MALLGSPWAGSDRIGWRAHREIVHSRAVERLTAQNGKDFGLDSFLQFSCFSASADEIHNSSKHNRNSFRGISCKDKRLSGFGKGNKKPRGPLSRYSHAHLVVNAKRWRKFGRVCGP